jgi:HK97 family phage major capsid protein
LGFGYVVNQDFPTIAASAKTIAFGDWSKYIVRLVQDFSLIRLDERYADELSTGFVAYARVDGKLLNSSAIKLLVQKA